MRVVVTVMPFARGGVTAAYAAAAARIAAGFARHDGPREVAALLERLADDRSPVVRAGTPLWA